MNAAIAQHLNVAQQAIVKIEEWKHVLFVVVRGIGARFVSKKVAAVSKKTQRITEFENWLQETEDRKNAPDAPANRIERLTKKIARLERSISALQGINENDSFWDEVESLTPALILDWQFGYCGKYMSLFSE